MNFDLTDAEHALQARAHEFATSFVAPRAQNADTHANLDPALIAALGREGYLGLLIPARYGGAEMSVTGFVAALAEIAHACASAGVLVALQNSVVAASILHSGSEEQKAAYLPRMATGELLGAYAFTEPEEGGAVDAMHATAERDGEGYLLSGTKILVAFGAEAGIAVVVGRIAGEEGLTAFLVEQGLGVSVRERSATMGMRATGLSTVGFDAVRVPASRRLGAEGGGAAMVAAIANLGRIAVAGLALGIGDAARDVAIERARTRSQSGQVIGRYQAIQWLIADSATELEAGRMLTLHAASLLDLGGDGDGDLTEAAAVAKLAASEACVRTASRSMEVHGPAGYLTGTSVERHYRDAKATELLQGTSEMQKLAIARRLLEAGA